MEIVMSIKIASSIILLAIAVAVLTPYTALAHTVTVDGDPSDWTGTPPSEVDTYTVSNGEWIWKDAGGDERTNFANPDPQVDLVEFRVTSDNNYLYFLIRLNDTSGVNIGDNGAPFIAITIDTDQQPGSGETWFASYSDTQVNSNAAWEYQILVNLADSRYSGQGLRTISHPLNESTNNWGAIFQLLYKDWSHVYVKGDDGTKGLLAVNLSYNAIEIRINWSLIGINDPTGKTLRFEVITARGWSDYNSDAGHTWDVNNASDALDCITTTGPNTWDEVKDGVVDYYFDVTFTGSPPQPIPEPAVVSIVALAVVAALLVFYKKKH